MTLTIHQEENDRRQLQVTVEVDEERVQKAMRRKARELSRQIEVPGFRRGKVPYQIIARRVGEARLRTETTEELIQPIFEEVMDEIDVTPYAQAVLDDVAVEPFVLEFTIPLAPEVDLGDYRAIRKEMDEVEITEEALDEALEHVRTHHEVLEPVDRPIVEGDLVTLSGTGEVEYENAFDVFFDEERIELLMDPEQTFPGTPFVRNLIGLEVGDHTEFTFTFPEEYKDEELAGNQGTFDVTILDVQSRYLPPLDDELAREEGDYETLEDLREGLRKELREQAEQQIENEFFDAMVDEMWERATINYPPAAVERELDQRLDNVKQQVEQSGWQWEDYLRLQGETEESLHEEWREGAVENLERSLVLRQFLQEEKLTVDADELDTAIEERLAEFDDSDEVKDELRDFFRRNQGIEVLSNELLMEKISDRLEAIASGNAPDLDELEAEEAEAEDAADVDEEE